MGVFPGLVGRRSSVVGWGLVAACALLLVVVRVLVGSQQAYRDGEEALGRGDVGEAIRGFEMAAHWYAPGAPWGPAALAALERIGEEAAAGGDRQVALVAYGSVRSAALATRGLTTPYQAALTRANGRLADLMAADPDALWPDRDLPPEARRAEVLRALEVDTMPSPGWSLGVVTAFFAWLGAAVGFILRGFDREGRLQRRPALGFGAAGVAAFAFWLLSMARA